MSTRIYVVTDVETNRHRLILAGTQAQAIRYAAQTFISLKGPIAIFFPVRFDIEVANQDDLDSLLTNGIPIELAGGPATADMFEDAITNAGGTD
jgi:hypothetical protein